MDKKESAAHPVCYRCLIAGRVQGVFYRASTRYEAQRRGLTGYARNLPDGRVEVVACGAPSALDELVAWLRKGPAGARVSGVACEVVDFHSYPQFTIG